MIKALSPIENAEASATLISFIHDDAKSQGAHPGLVIETTPS